MNKRRPLDITDIQDDADIYDRIVIRQTRRQPKGTAAPQQTLLSEKLRIVEENIKKRKGNDLQRTTSRNDAEDEDTQLLGEGDSSEELPVVIESEELQKERLILSIEDAPEKCRKLLVQYDELGLPAMFSDELTNCMFRLFLYAVRYEVFQHMQLSAIRRALFVRVLRDILQKLEVKEDIRGRFVGRHELLEKYRESNCVKTESSHGKSMQASEITRSVEGIEVPKRVLRLLE